MTKLFYLILSLVLSSYISAQSNDFTMKAALEQNIHGETAPSLFVGVSYKVGIVKFLQFEFGVSLMRHKMKASSSSFFEVPNQIGEHLLITELKTKEIAKLEYSSIPIGIVLNSKNRISLGIGVQPMFLIKQSREQTLELVNIYDRVVATDSHYEDIDFTPFNLEFYSYINLPVGKKMSILFNYSRGLIRINEVLYSRDYIGSKSFTLFTKRISLGLSYSIRN